MQGPYGPQETYGELSYDEIAANCGCPVDTVGTPAVSESMSLIENAQVAAMDALNEGGVQRAKAAAAMAMTALLLVQPAYADVQSAVKDLTDAAYPIIGSLKKDAVAPLTSKAIGVALTANPKDIIKLVDTGLDAFLSTSPDKFVATVKALKVATAEAKGASSCNLICLPSLEAAEKVGAAAGDALSTTDPAKLKAFAGQAFATFNSVDKLAAAPVLIDGAKFAGSLNPGDVAKATAAALELAKASGAA
jgi:hypothetical protein